MPPPAAVAAARRTAALRLYRRLLKAHAGQPDRAVAVRREWRDRTHAGDVTPAWCAEQFDVLRAAAPGRPAELTEEERGRLSALMDTEFRQRGARAAAVRAERLRLIGDQLIAKGQFRDAIWFCLRARAGFCSLTMEYEPRSAARYVQRAELYAQLGEHRDAARDAEEALRIDPACAEAHSQLGDALLGLGRPAAAVEAHRAACCAAPGTPALEARLASSTSATARRAAALQLYRRMLKAAPLADRCHVKEEWRRHRGARSEVADVLLAAAFARLARRCAPPEEPSTPAVAGTSVPSVRRLPRAVQA